MKKQYLIGSITSFVAAFLCAWIGSIITLEGLILWFSFISFATTTASIILIVAFFVEE